MKRTLVGVSELPIKGNSPTPTPSAISPLHAFNSESTTQLWQWGGLGLQIAMERAQKREGRAEFQGSQGWRPQGKRPRCFCSIPDASPDPACEMPTGGLRSSNLRALL